MLLKERFIREDSQKKLYNWKQYDYKNKLKYKYREENPVKVYHLSKEELEKYLKKFD